MKGFFVHIHSYPSRPLNCNSLPKMCDLIFQQNAESLFDLFEALFFFNSDRSDSIRPARRETHCEVTAPSYADTTESNLHQEETVCSRGSKHNDGPDPIGPTASQVEDASGLPFSGCLCELAKWPTA